MPSNKTNKNGLLSPVVAGFNGGGPRVPGLRSCFWLPVASHRAGHTGARVPPWVLASFFGGGVIGNASLGDTVHFFGNAVMPATVGAAGAAVGHGEWHGGGLVDVVAVGGRSVSEKCPSLEARGGGGGVGPRRRLRTVRSSGVPGPRDFPVSGGRARLSGLSIQQIGAVSASILSDSGAHFAAIKRLGGWKSTSVAEAYIEDSIQNKVNIAKQLFCTNETASSSKAPGDINITSNNFENVQNDLNLNINPDVHSTNNVSVPSLTLNNCNIKYFVMNNKK
jgi:hypothetical protein